MRDDIETRMNDALRLIGAGAPPREYAGPVGVGVDLGTANLVIAVVDEDGRPLTGTCRAAQVVRDGLVVDFAGAGDLLRDMKRAVEERLGRELTIAATAYPPGVHRAEVRSIEYVVQGAGFDTSGVIDEPSAAALVLELEDGVVVDVGGGTTGVAVIRDGALVDSFDEPTGGHHMTLVIAGAYDIPYEEAELRKVDPDRARELLPVVRPVMEKIATIVRAVTGPYQAERVILAGGTCCFPGMADVVAEITGVPTFLPGHPLFVTPVGIALHDLALTRHTRDVVLER